MRLRKWCEKHIFHTIFSLLALISISGNAFATLTVVTTTSDLKSFVEYVGGDKVRVISLVTAGGNAEEFNPKPQDLDRIKNASLVVRVGLDYDLWLDRLLRQSQRKEVLRGGPAYVDASNAIVLLEVKGGGIGTSSHGHAHGAGNPHYWLDPLNANAITGNIVEALARLDPSNAKFYEQQRLEFLKEIDRKTLEWQEKLLPLRGKPMLTYHNNWPYFARRFRLNISKTIETKPGVAPSAAELNRLLAYINKEDIKVVIRRPQEPSKEVDFLAKKSDAAVAVMSASVGDIPKITNYIQMIDDNVNKILDAYNKVSK